MSTAEVPAWQTPAVLARLVCPECGSGLVAEDARLSCTACSHSVPVIAGVPRFVDAPDSHENFNLQWNRFWDVQLDSRNGTHESRDRLLSQSQLSPDFFAGKSVLEVGCGSGRFTEILLAWGATVIGLDFSGAIDACARSNEMARRQGRLVVAQADVFRLPVSERSFDVVIGYGMLQHTGNPLGALECLWRRVRPGGLLLVDRYEVSLRRLMLLKYALRPVTRRLPPEKLLELSEKTCSALIPFQRAALKRLQGTHPLRRLLRYVINRSPTAVYALNLEAQGKLSRDMAERWAILETYDAYSARFDLPCTQRAWRAQLEALDEGEVVFIGRGGQGHVGVVRRRSQ